MKWFAIAALVISLVLSSRVQAQSNFTKEISDAEFARLHAEIVTKPALWNSIPWQTSLLKAQQQAAKENKPLFIWSMDGNPLGCT